MPVAVGRRADPSRVPRRVGQAEPISHFTDAVQAGDLLFVSGIVPVDANRELVGGDDVVAQARAVFANMGEVLAAAGCTFADVVKVTVFLTDIDDRPLVNPVRQEVFGDAARLDPRRGLGARDPRRADRGRGRGACRHPVACRATAGTPGSPGSTSRSAERATGPLAGRTLLVKDLIDTAGIRTTYGSRIYGDHVPERNASVVDRVLDAGATVLGKANLVEFAWGVLGDNPWYGTVRNPVGRAGRRAARRAGTRPRSPRASATSGSGRTRAARCGFRPPRARSSA